MPTTVETQGPKQETDLKDLAQDVVARAMAGGATTAEAVVREGDEFSTVVRLGQVETLKEAGSKSIGVRVFYGQRAASTYSSDFSRQAIDRMVKSALELAKIRERTNRGFDAKFRRTQRYKPGQRDPYGYRKVGVREDATYEVDPAEAAVVRLAVLPGDAALARRWGAAPIPQGLSRGAGAPALRLKRNRRHA